jgi:hypothetical protein
MPETSAKRPSDKDKILSLLKREGSVDSFRLRREGYSGNPSQRIRELKDAGHQIHAERFVRDDGRAGARYTLVRKESLVQLALLG